MLFAFSNDDLVVYHAHHLFGDCEGVWSKVEIAGSEPLHVGSFHRPPNPDVKTTLKVLDQTLCQLAQRSLTNILLTGDFKLQSVSWAEDNYSTI